MKQSRGSRPNLKLILPLAVVAVSAIITVVMIRARPEVETRQRVTPPPLVRVVTVQLQDLQLSVHTQGTVAPRTESTLVPEVSGRVMSVSPSFAAGGFFERDEVLLTIDRADHEAAVASARSLVAQAELRYAREEEEATMARQDWQALGSGAATSLTLREPQLAEAQAALAAARATLARAERDLERTRIRAPFAGRVRRKSVDVGQVVTRGAPIGVIYSTDVAEIRLPLPDEELAYLAIPLGYRGETGGAADLAAAPQVILRGTFAGRQHEWTGRIVRTEGELDPQSRMVHVVAQVDDPYGRGSDDPDRPPMAVGMFVAAEILGHTVRDVVVIPRAAVRGDDRVLVADDDARLFFRQVGIVKYEREMVIIDSGLNAGDRVCLSALDASVDGMQVRTVDDAPPPEDSL